MKRTGFANLPLHSGKCPPWLFGRMKKLAGVISEAIIYEYSQKELLRRIADPYFFQALGCVLGFDWHSSGLTTTVCGALKEALDAEEHGIAVCGGKGRASRMAPREIERASETFSLSTTKTERLVYASRMAAKVDNACVQDGYQLYHHAFFIAEGGEWAVVQQGMHESYARRYHWLSSNVKSFVEEPHEGICSDALGGRVLNMVAEESGEAREASVALARENPLRLKKYLKPRRQLSLEECLGAGMGELSLPRRHPLLVLDVGKKEMETLRKAYELQPESYEELVALRGIGPKSVRALALLSELIYGSKPSWRDPAKYSFAHGGKDGYPYPVDRATYDSSIETLKNALEEAKLEKKEKYRAIKRLKDFLGE
jgi:hypothetical protein